MGLSKKAEEDAASLAASKAAAKGNAIEDVKGNGEDEASDKDAKMSTLRSMLKYDKNVVAAYNKATLDKRDEIHKAYAKRNNEHVTVNSGVMAQFKEQIGSSPGTAPSSPFKKPDPEAHLDELE